MANLSALIKACRYSYEPNRLGYCGPFNAFEQFLSFVNEPSEKKAAETESLLRQFPALYPYLSLIAKKNNKEPFDEEVIEAYWLGNCLLEEVKTADIKELILTDFSKPGLLPKAMAQEKADNLPEGISPNHVFHVLYMNFITGKVKPLLQNLDNCLISWGEVKKVQKNSLSVKAIKLIFEGNEFKLIEKAKKINRGFTSDCKKGDFVSIHWERAVEVLDEDPLDNLIRYTKSNLESVNSALG